MKKALFDNITAIDCLTIIVVVFIALYAILPMIIFGSQYIFTVHDNLDSHAAYIQYIHDNDLLFSFFDEYPVMGGIPGYYFLSYLSYGVSGILEGLLGYYYSQVAIRIIGVILGYFSLRFLFKQIFGKHEGFKNGLSRIIAIIYAVTPVSLIRTLSFAVLPLIAGMFLFLAKEKRFRKIAFVSVLFPFFSYFNSLTLFAIAFWGIGWIVNWIKNKKININLMVSLFAYILGTVISDLPIIYLVLKSSETNRILSFAPSAFSERRFRELLRFAQYHAASYHHYILIWCVLIGSVYLTIFYFNNRNSADRATGINKMRIIFLWSGLIMWIAAAFIQAFSETNRKTGILLIDGFQWGRLIGWGRFLWIILFAVVIVSAINTINCANNSRRTISFYITRIAMAIGTILCIYLLLNWLFSDLGFPNDWSSFLPERYKSAVNVLRWGAIGIFAMGVFFEHKRLVYIGICLAIGVHGIFVLTSNDSYTDTARSLYYSVTGIENDESINYGEFYDTPLFAEIKKDIDYSDEGVAAFGFHPSVLLFNGFKSIDGYLSIHPMNNQIEFRKIIAPYLSTDPFYQNYYDNWGGRMYLFGEISSDPTRNKDEAPAELQIDINAFQEYGGVYVFSRAVISNAEELGIRLVGDYTRDDSIYHIFLYQTN